MWLKRTFLYSILLISLVMKAHALASSQYPSVALYYGSNVPVDELHAFDVVVIDPEAKVDPKKFDDANSHLYAYVSFGEWGSNKKIPDKKWIAGSNRTWGSLVIDQTNPGWREYLINTILADLVKQGYQGVFFDTMDSHHFFANSPKLREQQEAASIETLKAIKVKYPNLHIILNRGFEIVPKVAKLINGVAVESMYSAWDHNRKQYSLVSSKDRQWVQTKMQEIKKLGLWPIVIDYVDPVDRQKTQQIADKIEDDGFIPYVTNGALTSLGIGTVAVVPRTILVIYDSKQFPDIVFSDAMRFAAFPLERMGFVPRLIDVRKPLPEYPLTGRVAGVLAWLNGQLGKRAMPFDQWLKSVKDQRVPISLVGSIDYFDSDSQVAKAFGIRLTGDEGKQPYQIVDQSPMLGFETKPYLTDTTFGIKNNDGNALITVKDNRGDKTVGAALMPWGGFALDPFVIHETTRDQTYWVINPFSYFKKSLKLKLIPIPDVTTKNGLRMLMVHVDGDGWVTKSQWFKGPIAAKSLLDNILQKYKIPSTISVIEGEISKEGPYPEWSKQGMDVARDIYKLPWVEVATHTFSHPFKWRLLARDKVGEGYNLPIKGYRYDPNREITGSAAFIDKYLAPPGKRCGIVLWSGDTNPDETALAIAYKDGLLNMNGGETLITKTRNTLTAIAPIGIMKGDYLQVYAPNQNENVYTDGWTGPFYGYRRVIETFELTGTPHRYKPIDIYFHTYSASKKASLSAVNQAYQWALSQPTNKVYSSEYIKRAMRYYHVVVARQGDDWVLKGIGELNEFRTPENWGVPKLSARVMGFDSYDNSHYIHVFGQDSVRLSFGKGVEVAPAIDSVNGSVAEFKREGNQISLNVNAPEPVKLDLISAGQCQLSESGKQKLPVNVKNGHYIYQWDKRSVNAITAKCTA